MNPPPFDPAAACGNCDWEGPSSHCPWPPPDLADRLDPGGVVPAGECPTCGRFAYVRVFRLDAIPYGTPLAYPFHFAVSHAVPRDGEVAGLRAAAAAYYRAVPADQEERARGYDPTWGDAVDDLPASAWEAYGFRLLDDAVDDSATVDCDEALFDLDAPDGEGGDA